VSAGTDADAGPKGRHGERQPERQSFWISPTGLVTLGFLGVAGYYLITEHTVHFFSVLPWLLLAACPVMHLFMHHGHHGGNDHDRGAAPGPGDKP
jgi:hypothetical protein